MKISKSQFNTLAKKASKIVCDQTYQTGFGRTFTQGITVSYREAHAVLMRCAPWSVDQIDATTLQAKGVGCAFTVTLAADSELADQAGQLVTDKSGAQISNAARIVNIVQVLGSTLYGQYVDGTARTVKYISGKRWQLI